MIRRVKGELYVEGISLANIAKEFSTPCYVYSKKAIEENYLSYVEALGSQSHLVCYAVKSNSNIAVLQLLSSLGAGFDVVSIGELERVLLAGGDPKKVVFSGLAKTEEEMSRALAVGIHCFNVESQSESASAAMTIKRTSPRQKLTTVTQWNAVSHRVLPRVDIQANFRHQGSEITSYVCFLFAEAPPRPRPGRSHSDARRSETRHPRTKKQRLHPCGGSFSGPA